MPGAKRSQNNVWSGYHEPAGKNCVTIYETIYETIYLTFPAKIARSQIALVATSSEMIFLYGGLSPRIGVRSCCLPAQAEMGWIE
jgi:hypothetical protein